MRSMTGIALLLTWSLSQPSWAADLPTGLSKTKPTSGRYVKTEQGYMVPYTVTIPGTDVSFSMEPIPGGSFTMGSPESEEGRNDDEGPQVEIKVDPFWIGTHEVTWAEYKEFMNLYSVFKEFETRSLRSVTEQNQVDAITAPTELYDPSFTFEFGEDPEQPAVTMTQYAAKQYTKWLSAITAQQFRLPAEAEWEYACRAGTTGAFSFGDGEVDDYVWYYENADAELQAVGSKKPNAWGLYDMHGNVWEWVLDAYSEEGYSHLKGKTVNAVESIAWPTELYPRVVRGGSWDDDPEMCRSAARMPTHDEEWSMEDPNLPLSPWWFTSDPSRAVGFRLVRPLKELSRKEIGRYWEADVEETKFAVTSRLEEGRGAQGIVDKELPEAIKALEEE